jgi:PAS domain S-box-containing protein
MRDLYLQRQQADELLRREMSSRARDTELLRAAEQRLDTIIQQSGDAIAIIAGKMISRISMANRAFLELVGCSSREVLGRSIFDFMPEAEKIYESVLGDPFSIDEHIYDDMYAKMMELLDCGRVSNWEFFLLDSGGRVVLLEANAAFFSTGRDEREAAVIIFRDISHRKATERRLRQANERLQQEIARRSSDIELLQATRKRLETIIERSGDGILISDSLEMVIQTCNKAFCELVGFERGELTGQSIFNLMPEIGQRYTTTLGDEILLDEEFYAKSRPLMGRLHEQGMISNWELFFLNRDRLLVPVEINTAYIYADNEPGEFLGSVSVVRNITQHKRIERQLQQANEFLENIIQSSIDGIIISDAGGRITSLNQAALELMGYERQELLGRTPDSFAFFDEGMYETTAGEQLWVSREQILAAYSRMEIFFSEGKINNFFFFIKRRDGRLVEVEANIAMLYDQQRQPVGSVSIMRDITLRRRMEHELLQQHDQLVAANKELESFAYSVSHDLRAPLRSISGFSSAIEEDFSAVLPAEGLHYLERIRAAAGRMGILIDDMLKLSRVSRHEMRREPVNLSALALDVEAQLREREPDRQVACSIQPGLFAMGDGNLLRIVLENLLDNAWKYTGLATPAEVVFAAADKSCGEAGEHGRSLKAYRICDNGVGFDMAYADKLFGAFQRLHADSEFPGTGIGLATVQRIVHRHGGRIWARSAPGKGSQFYFTLP